MMKFRFNALPGFAPDVAGMLRHRAAAPLRPVKAQAVCDIGLFSDEADQMDLVEMFQDLPEGFEDD